MKHLILKMAPILALCVATAHASTPSLTAGRSLYREHCMSWVGEFGWPSGLHVHHSPR